MPPPLAHYREGEVADGGRKQQVMRQNPKPVADVQSRKKSGKAGRHIKIGKGIIRQFWEPDFPREQITCLAAHFLRPAEIQSFGCGLRYHRLLRDGLLTIHANDN